jgi:CRISPR-associated endonuclease Cas1 subtype II
MSWRTVVITETSKLDYQIGYLVVRGHDTVRIHLEDIETLIIESTAVSMTAYLLSELVKNKTKVIFCDEKRNPSSELLPYYGSHDTSAKIRNQIAWTKEKKGEVWTEIVREKIHQQAINLDQYKKIESQLLYQYIDEMEFGDETNREGHAAKVYFNALFGKKFSRKEDNSINAALNYGYALILSAFSREVVSSGYITQVGLFHDNMFNQFNLACDLMEPFRPIIDDAVYLLMPEKFEIDEKHEMIKVLNKEVTINGRAEVLQNAVKIYSKSVFETLDDKGPGSLRFFER